MRLLCFVLISSDLIGNSPVFNNRTRQKYDRLAWEGARDTKWVLNYHGAREHISRFLVKSQMRFQGRNGAHVIVPRCTAGDHGLSSFTIPLGKILSNFHFFFRKSCHHCFNFISENLVKLSTFFPQKILSNFQLFYFNYCYNEASRLGALSRYQIKREETSDEGGVLIQSQKEHEF